MSDTHTIEMPDYLVQEQVPVDPAKTALVIVDMQNDFVWEGGSLVVPDAIDTVPKIQNLIDLARSVDMKIVYTQDTHYLHDPEWDMWPEHCKHNTWGWQIIDSFSVEQKDAVITKMRYDAFFGTSLEYFLKIWGIDTLIICGTVANICVHYTAASAAQRWFKVIIPKDAISANNEFDVELSLYQTHVLFNGIITDSESIYIQRSF